MPTPYIPLFEITRGGIVESVHFGAVAVVDISGQLIASIGDPNLVSYLRSSAKPFQALPFVEHGGPAALGLLPCEVALMCASHSGTDEHVATARSIQAKGGICEADLLCGAHPPGHQPTARDLLLRGEEPTPNRHNCSGKHSGMLAYARLRGWPIENYIHPHHPVQVSILNTFAAMCNLAPSEIVLGTDGCSAPNFAVPLRNAAWAYARLCDPTGLTEQRAAACRTITSAMTAHPEMVGGPDSFDTHLMRAMAGKVVCKGGAEGYQALGLLPGALGSDLPALGIAIKISDGDLGAHAHPPATHGGHARPAVVLEILRQLGAVSAAEMQTLAEFGPTFEARNWRNLLVGEARPCFELQRHA